MATLAELAILLTAKDTASSVIDKVTGKAGGLGKAFIAGAAAGGTALVGMGIALNNLGGEFDSVYDNIRSTTGATGETLNGLKDSFKNVVKDIPADFGVAGQAIADIATRTGLTGKPLEDLSKNIIELSRLTGTDVPANVALATRVFGDWSIATEHQSETLDKVLRAGQLTGISVADLMQKVVQFGAPLRAMNFSFEESVAMLGKWEKEGVNTELVLGSLRIAMGDFARQNIPMRKGLEDTIKEIQRLGPSAAATSLAMKVFGARAGPDMAAAILEGRFELGNLISQIESGEDTILGLGEETADASEKMKLAFNRLKIAAEPLAESVFLGVAKAADLFAKASLGAIPIMQRLSAVLTTKFQAALPSITAIGKQFVTLGRYISAVVKDGDTLNDFLGDLSPGFRAVAFIIGTSITQLKSLGRAFLDVVQSPIARWLKDALGSFFEFAFGIRNLGSDVASASGPLTIIAGAVTGLIAAMAVGAVLGFVGAIGGLAASILTFPLGPLGAASGLVADFVKNAAGLVSKAISITANVVTSGAEALANLLTNKAIDVKPKLGDTADFDEFFSRERTISAKVDAKDISIPKPAAENAVLKAFSGLGSLLGPILGTAFGFALNNPTLRTTIETALSRLGGPWGRAAGLAAGIAFGVAFEEVGGPVGAGLLAFSGIDVEGWKLAFSVLGREVDIAIEGYKLAWENMEFWGVVSFLNPANWAAEFAKIGFELGIAIGNWETDWGKVGGIFVPPLLDVDAWKRAFDVLGTSIDDAIVGYRAAWQAIDLGGLPSSVQNQLDEFTRAVERWRTRINEFFRNPFGKAQPAIGAVGRERGEGESEAGNVEPALGSPRLVTREAFEAMQGEAGAFTVPTPDLSGFIAAFENAKISVMSTLEGLRVSVAEGLGGMVAGGQEILDSMAAFVAGAFAKGIGGGVNATLKHFTEFVGGIGRRANDAIGLLENWLDSARRIFATFQPLSWIAGALSALILGITGALAQVVSAIATAVQNAFTAFAGFRPWDAVSGAFSTLTSNAQSRLDDFLGMIRGAASTASDLWNDLTKPKAAVPLPVFVPTPTPPAYEQPPDTGQDDAYSYQTEPGQYKVVPGAPEQAKVVMAHGGEIIGRPFKNAMRGLKSYQTEEGEFKEIDGPLGASIPILAHGGEAILPMSELRERVATVGFGDKQVVSPFDRAQQTIYEIVNSIVQASHTLGTALEEQAGQFLGHLQQTRFGGFIDSVVGIVRSKDLLANEPIFDPSKAIRYWDETFSEFMYRHDLGHLVGPDDRIFEDEFYRALDNLISQSSGKVSSYQSLDPITGQHESASRELAAKLAASGSLFPTEVAARILGATSRPESKGEETSKLGIREVFQNPLGEFWTRFGGSIEQPPPGFEFSYPEHFGVGIREAFQNAIGDFWTRPAGNSEEPPPGFELAYPETFATAVREVFKNALEEFWTRPAGSEQEPPPGFEFAYPESFQTKPGETKVVPGATSQPRIIMAHGGEIIGRPLKAVGNAVMSGFDKIKSYATAPGEFKVVEGALGDSVPIMAHGGEVIGPESDWSGVDPGPFFNAVLGSHFFSLLDKNLRAGIVELKRGDFRQWADEMFSRWFTPSAMKHLSGTNLVLDPEIAKKGYTAWYMSSANEMRLATPNSVSLWAEGYHAVWDKARQGGDIPSEIEQTRQIVEAMKDTDFASAMNSFRMEGPERFVGVGDPDHTLAFALENVAGWDWTRLPKAVHPSFEGLFRSDMQAPKAGDVWQEFEYAHMAPDFQPYMHNLISDLDKEIQPFQIPAGTAPMTWLQTNVAQVVTDTLNKVRGGWDAIASEIRDLVSPHIVSLMADKVEVQAAPTGDTSPRVREVFQNALGEFWTRLVGSPESPPFGFHFAYPESFQTAPGQMKMVPGGMNQPRLIMAHGGEAVMRPINASSGFSSTSTNSTSGPISVAVNMGGVHVHNEADEQRLAQTIVQGLEESLDRQFGMSTSFPHGLRGKA